MYTPFNDEIQIHIQINHSPFERCVNDTLWTAARKTEREGENEKNRNSSIANERNGKREREKNLTFNRRKHGSFVKCSLLEMN